MYTVIFKLKFLYLIPNDTKIGHKRRLLGN